MSFRAIVCPLEGVLADAGGAVAEADARALRRTVDRRLSLLLTSPRPVAGLRRALAAAGLGDLGAVLIGCRGAEVIDAGTGHTLARTGLPADVAEAVTACAAQLPGALPMSYAGTRLASTAPGDPRVLAAAAWDGLDVVDLADGPPSDAPAGRGPAKLAVAFDHEPSRPEMERLRAAAGDAGRLWRADGGGGGRALATATGPTGAWVDVTAAAASPEAALGRWLAFVGLVPQTVVAFGYAEDDVPLMAESGLSVAMADAAPAAREAAGARTRGAAEGGLAAALGELGLA